MSESKQHWFIRVGDGKNLQNGKWSVWGIREHYIRTIRKMKFGDILWFITSKPYGGKVVGMATFRKYFNRNEQNIYLTDREQKWVGHGNWNIIIVFSHFYEMKDIEYTNTKIVLNEQTPIIMYQINNVKHIIVNVHKLFETESKKCPSKKYKRLIV